ncbi:MAG: hypothetical protein SFW08_13940 [Gemmatimonadaceae bacterium]|nr:hypothetical protein [Gemmatimonadaceae bacterium]
MRRGPSAVRAVVPPRSAPPPLTRHDAETAFDRLRRDAAQLRRARFGAVCPPEDAADRVRAGLASARVVSFDVFDTLITRACGAPSDLFLVLGEEPAFAPFDRSPSDWRSLRQQAERAARERRMREHRQAEVTLEEIYGALAQMLGVSADVASALAHGERAVEQRLVRANAPVVAWWNEARDAGLRTIAVSDTWHSADQLHALLEQAGIRIARTDVFTSADARTTKQEGPLFDVVARSIGVPMTEWFHIGDHPVSDARTPAAKGARVLLHPFVGATAGGTSLADSVRSGLLAAARHDRSNTAFTIGYRALGPLMTGFAVWIADRARQARADRIVFLLRDGLLFERVFRVIAPEHPPTRLLEASRRAALLPALLADPDWALVGLLAGVGRRPVREYLERLGVPTAPFASALARAGLSTLDALVDARVPADREEVLKLFSAGPALDALLARAARERRGLVAALRRAEILSDRSPSLLVDLGWNGTIQKALHRVAAEVIGAAPAWDGLYLATWPGIVDGAPREMRSASYLAHAGEPRAAIRAITPGRELLEIVCSSRDGSLLHFDESTGHPVLAAYEFDAAQADIVATIQDGAVAFAADYARVHRGRALPMDVGTALAEWERLVRAPTDREARTLGVLAHSDNVGSSSSRALAVLRADPSDAAALLEEYQQSYWKPGALGVVSPQSAALRQLLWMVDQAD